MTRPDLIGLVVDESSETLTVLCPTMESCGASALGLLNDGRALVSIPLHQIIDDLGAKLRAAGVLDESEFVQLRASSPAAMLLTPFKTKRRCKRNLKRR